MKEQRRWRKEYSAAYAAWMITIHGLPSAFTQVLHPVLRNAVIATGAEIRATKSPVLVEKESDADALVEYLNSYGEEGS